MELYVKLTDSEYEQFKELKSNKNKNLSDYPSSELTSALLKAIENEGGATESRYEGNCYITISKIRNQNFDISLVIKKY